MAPSVTDSLKAALISVILAVGVSGIIVCVLVLMLALFGTGLRTALVSKTCFNTSEYHKPRLPQASGYHLALDQL
jgi:hypothetical protein